MTKGRPKNTGKEERLPLSAAHVAFGKRLAQLRGDRSQQAIARDAHVSNGTISDLENGYTDPKLSTIVRLARAYKVPIAEILGSQIEQRAAAPAAGNDHEVSQDDRLAALEESIAALSERMNARDAREVRPVQRGEVESVDQADQLMRAQSVERAQPFRKAR